MLKVFQEKLGPGLIYAAVAVGVSHLVQSTRAGATYGLTMILLVVLVCLVKYPTFLFAARYTAITGKTVIQGYENRGRWFLYFFLFLQAAELMIATSAVALVTGGVVNNVFDLDADAVWIALALIVFTIVLLAIGRYRVLEQFSKVLVVVFCIATLIATGIAFIGFDTGDAAPAASMAFDRPTILFLIAIAGWMPTGMVGAVTLSMWTHARQEARGIRITQQDADFDFNVGYGATILIAICFVVLGYIVLLGGGVAIVDDPAGFAAQLMSLFTTTLGQWAHAIVAAAAIAVMYSSLLALVDAFPRVSSDVLERLWPEFVTEARLPALYLILMGVVFVGASVILGLFFQSFTRFLDVVTAIGFLVAPFIAWFNHVVIFSDDVPQAAQPGTVLRNWSRFTIVTFTAVALLWIYFQLTG